MIFFRKSTLIIAVFTAFISISRQVAAQNNITLQMGDKAPELKYQKWIKGEPTAITGEKVYILEFWATWCAPCIDAMPHLSELAKKYEKEAVFIGCNVLEKTNGKSYDSMLPQVEKFVSGNSSKMTYNVIFDTNEQFMRDQWLRASGKMAIPTTFVIKGGKVAWIGHPAALEKVLEPIIKGEFDLEDYKKKAKASKEIMEKQMENYNQALKAIQIANEAKDYTKALSTVDEALVKQPIFKVVFSAQKFGILLKKSGNAEAISYADSLYQTKEANMYRTVIAKLIGEQDGLSGEVYQLAVDSYLKITPVTSANMSKAALVASKQGDSPKAVQLQQKAIDLGKEELNNPNFAGKITEDTLLEYQKQLKNFQSKVK